MSGKQEIMIVAENSGFFPSAMSEQLTAYGYNVIITELEVQKLFDLSGEYEENRKMDLPAADPDHDPVPGRLQQQEQGPL